MCAIVNLENLTCGLHRPEEGKEFSNRIFYDHGIPDSNIAREYKVPLFTILLHDENISTLVSTSFSRYTFLSVLSLHISTNINV